MIDTIVYEKKDSLSAIALLVDRELRVIEFCNDKQVSEGDVYLARITSKLEMPNGNVGFFVDINDKKEAFLSEQEDGLEENLSEGQSLVVQVLNEARDEKGARVGRGIKLAGSNLVYCPYQITVSLSSKIREEKTAEEYRQLVVDNTTGQEGWILRTSILGAKSEDVIEEMKELRERYELIRNKAKNAKASALLYSNGDCLFSNISLYSKSLKTIVVSSHNIEKELKEKFGNQFEIEYSKSPFDDFGLDEAINDALLREVKLKNGGSIFIEETRAFVAIDVDSGSDFGGGPISRLNSEAAVEIAKQIRLRNLAGKIVIDFAGSSDYKYMKPILDVLRDELQKDEISCYFAGLSRGGNVELIRSRRRPSLRGLMTEECDSCQGSGWSIR